MATPNYGFEKRKREEAKRKKREEKRLRKLARKNITPEENKEQDEKTY